MNTYGSTVARGTRVTDDDVAKGLKIKGLLKVKKPLPPQVPKPYNPVSNVKPGGRLQGNVQGVGKAFGGPARRAASYAEWGRMAGPANSHASGLGPGQKTLTRAIELSGSAKNPDAKRRAFALWQRDNNRRGSWRGLHEADGRHVNLDDTRWESGVYGLNTKQQRKMATEASRRRDGRKVSPVKARRGVADDLEMYEHPDDFTNRVRRGEFKKGVLRQGVIRPIARINPVQTARRTVTGDKVNVRRVIGKSDEVAKFGLGSLEQVTHGLKGIRTGLTGGWKAGRTGGKLSTAGPLSKPFMGAQKVGQAAGQRPMATAAAAGGLGTAAVLGGNGHRNRRDALYAPSYATGPIFAKLYAEQDAKGWRDDDGNRGKGAYPIPGRAKKVKAFTIGKRSYDPENDRRYRQGAAAAGSGIAGVTLGAHGARGIHRDSKDLRGMSAPDKRFVPAEVTPLDSRGKPRSERALKTNATERKNAQAINHAAETINEAKKLKGHLVRGRNAGKLGAGVALLGLSGALNRNRHEERWD